jgi:hypothetical protein
VTTTDLPVGVARLNLSTGLGTATAGLFAVVTNNTKMTIRQLSNTLLTGSLEDVAVRPSTGLKLRETPGTVYRVLSFTNTADNNGPYDILVNTATPTIFRITLTITDIVSNVCTTSGNHKLRIGDKIIPTSTANNFVSGITYYIITQPTYNTFTVSSSPGGSTFTLTNGAGLSIKAVKTHKLLEAYTISFTTTGTLPAPLLVGETYYVLPNNLTETQFSISTQKNGAAVSITTAGSGIHRYNIVGLTLTQTRENYNYIDITVFQPGEFISSTPTGTTCTISIANPAVVTLVGHGFSAGDVVKFTTTGALPTGISIQNRYFVVSTGNPDTFQITDVPGDPAIETSGIQSGVQKVGLVTGRAGDNAVAVIAISTTEISRLSAAKFVYLGEEYVISSYQGPGVTGTVFGRITLNRPLVNAINNLSTSYTIKAAVAVRTSGSLGTLTIRIALTRVTGHDLLEIGTGSYADTNYPKEIYGGSVNPVDDSKETEERDVGRVFYVTTDQFGNFSVGPFFRVDQGTGQVTFSSSIALSNLDGIGFKRGVPVSEFSTDSGFTDNATDTVPTENATRKYIDRRLGISHEGAAVVAAEIIPFGTGGFMSLDGQLGMQSTMNLNFNKIANVADPTDPQDAVNLRSLTFTNLQNYAGSNVQGGQVMVFTGVDDIFVNASVTGDLTFDLRTGIDSSLNNIDVQLNAGVVNNAEVNAAAAIDQSKLAMTIATAQSAAPVGSAAVIQAASGLSSFSNADFDVTDGHVTIKANSVQLGDLAQLAPDTLIGNSGVSTANAAAVAFADVVNDGLAIKKSQYSTVGFLRRTGATATADGSYSVVAGSAGSSSSIGANEIIVRDTNGDFGGRTVDVSNIKIDTQLAVDSATTATGGYLRYYGYNSAGGILISEGSLATDDKTSYWNDSHEFKTQNGVSNAPITAVGAITSTSTITCTGLNVGSGGSLTTGGNGNPGTIIGTWSLNPGSRMQATYAADLAEYYEGDREYEVGTVLVFGGDKEVTMSNIKGDTRVAGVVSDNAAFIMYDACPGLKNLVALQGRVPCKVVGKISKGDILITSGIPGVAVAATGDVRVGTVVGKALIAYDSDHIGSIEIAVGRT